MMTEMAARVTVYYKEVSGGILVVCKYYLIYLKHSKRKRERGRAKRKRKQDGEGQ